METLIYIGKVSLYWALFYTCYLLFLRRQTFFGWNRFYLLGSLLISLTLPFLIYPDAAPKIPVMYEVRAASFTMTAQTEQQAPFAWTNLLWLVYGLGVMFMSLKLYQNIRQLTGFLNQGEKIKLEDCTVVLINSNHVGSFSFLNWIVVNRNDYEHHFDAILRHEMVHMRQYHSVDILLVESLKIIFWFNPLLIAYKKSLQEIHEFLADAKAPNRESYATFLVAYALNAPIASLTNHFFKPSQIKTRIRMIYKNRTSKWLLSTYMLAFTMIGMVALFVAGCEQQEQREAVEQLAGSVKKPVSLEGKKIFTAVEQQPEFPGGIEAMYKFLGENIKYPKPAVDANAHGRVFLSFVVTESGETADIKVLKGIGFGCDEEAVRVLSMFPKWTPARHDGVPVNVRYHLPINFQLEETEKASKTDKQFNNPDGSKATFMTGGRVIQESSGDNDKNIYVTSANPLYVIDGKIEEDPELIEKIDPKNILSVDVLKEQKAMDAYGEKGSHGVISITTKKH